VHEPRQPDRQPGERDGALLHRVPDVVRRTSLSRATVNRLLASGEIPSITIGRAHHEPRVTGLAEGCAGQLLDCRGLADHPVPQGHAGTDEAAASASSSARCTCRIAASRSSRRVTSATTSADTCSGGSVASMTR
jgi:hypothetical protein